MMLLGHKKLYLLNINKEKQNLLLQEKLTLN